MWSANHKPLCPGIRFHVPVTWYMYHLLPPHRISHVYYVPRVHAWSRWTSRIKSCDLAKRTERYWHLKKYSTSTSFLVIHVHSDDLILSGARTSTGIVITTHFPLDKMATVLQTLFSDFLLLKRFAFRSKFHWNFFLRVQLTISQHWFR